MILNYYHHTFLHVQIALFPFIAITILFLKELDSLNSCFIGLSFFQQNCYLQVYKIQEPGNCVMIIPLKCIQISKKEEEEPRIEEYPCKVTLSTTMVFPVKSLR